MTQYGAVTLLLYWQEVSELFISYIKNFKYFKEGELYFHKTQI